MRITYRGVKLEVIYTLDRVQLEIQRCELRAGTSQTTSISVQESTDGTTYLYTRWTIDVDTVFNPAANAFLPAADPDGPNAPLPAADPIGLRDGTMPPDTDIALRHRLSQPRGVLILQDDDNRLILRSPESQVERSDAYLGPWVEECDVTKIQGLKTWNIHLRIVTWVNECKNKRTITPLLAHRWTQFMDVDLDYFATRVTQGEAIFRVDEIVRLGRFPDEYRGDLFHSIPPTFKRGPIHVEAISDGSGVRYSFTDTEQPFDHGTNSPATRIEVYQTHWYAQTGIWQAAANGVGSVIGGAPGAYRAGAAAGTTGTIASGSGIAAVGGLAAMSAGGAVVATIPQYSYHVMVRAWGDRNSNRAVIGDMAFAIALARVGPVNTRFASEVIATHEVTGKFVEVQITHKTGLEEGARSVVTIGQQIGAAVVDGFSLFGSGVAARTFAAEARRSEAARARADGAAAGGGPNLNGPAAGARAEALGIRSRIQQAPFGGSGLGTEEVNVFVYPGQSPIRGVITRAPIGNRPPPNSNGTRGTSLVAIVAQALSESCQLPPAPPPTADTTNRRVRPGKPYIPLQTPVPVSMPLFPGDVFGPTQIPPPEPPPIPPGAFDIRPG